MHIDQTFSVESKLQQNNHLNMTLEINPLDLQVTQAAIPMLIESEEEQNVLKRHNPFLVKETKETVKKFKVDLNQISKLPMELIFIILNVSNGAGSNFLNTCSFYHNFSKEYLLQFTHLLIKENAQFLNPKVLATKGDFNILSLIPTTYSLYASFHLESALQMLNTFFNAEALTELDKIKEDNEVNKPIKKLCDFIRIKEECLFHICTAIAPIKPEEALKCTSQILHNKDLLINALCTIYTQENLPEFKSAEILNQIEHLITSLSEDEVDIKEEATVSLVKLYALKDLSHALNYVKKMSPLHNKFEAYAHISLCYAKKGQFIKAWEVFNWANNELLSIHEEDDEDLFDTDYATLAELVSELSYIQSLKNFKLDNYDASVVDELLNSIVDIDLKSQAIANVLSMLAKYDAVKARSMMDTLDTFCECPGVEVINGLLKLGLNIQAEEFSTSKPNDEPFTNGTKMVLLENLAHTDFELALEKAIAIECLYTKSKLLTRLAKFSSKFNKLERSQEKAIELYEQALILAKGSEENPSYLISNIATTMAPEFLEKALKEISMIEDNHFKIISINNIVEQLILKLKMISTQ